MSGISIYLWLNDNKAGQHFLEFIGPMFTELVWGLPRINYILNIEDQIAVETFNSGLLCYKICFNLHNGFVGMNVEHVYINWRK